MNSYIMTLILRSDLEDKAREELLASVKKNMEKVEKEDLWGNRDLAYPINKQTKGYYAHFEFTASPEVIPTLDKNLRLEEDVIRYLLLRKD